MVSYFKLWAQLDTRVPLKRKTESMFTRQAEACCRGMLRRGRYLESKFSHATVCLCLDHWDCTIRCLLKKLAWPPLSTYHKQTSLAHFVWPSVTSFPTLGACVSPTRCQLLEGSRGSLLLIYISLFLVVQKPAHLAWTIAVWIGLKLIKLSYKEASKRHKTFLVQEEWPGPAQGSMF